MRARNHDHESMANRPRCLFNWNVLTDNMLPYHLQPSNDISRGNTLKEFSGNHSAAAGYSYLLKPQTHHPPSTIMTSEPPEFLSISEDLVPSTVETPSQEVILTFDGLLNPPLILQTNETQCGGKLWPAGMVLAGYLLRNKMDETEGKTMFVRSIVHSSPHHPYYNASIGHADQVPLTELNSVLEAALLGMLFEEDIIAYGALMVQSKTRTRTWSPIHRLSYHYDLRDGWPSAVTSPSTAQHRSQRAQFQQLDLCGTASLIVGPANIFHDTHSTGFYLSC